MLKRIQEIITGEIDQDLRTIALDAIACGEEDEDDSLFQCLCVQIMRNTKPGDE